MANDTAGKGASDKPRSAEATPDPAADEPTREPVEYLRENSSTLFGVGADVLDGALVDAGLSSRKNLSRDEVVDAIEAYGTREVVAGEG